MRLLVLALDGLEHDLVVRWRLGNLLGAEWGTTDLSLIRANSPYPCTPEIWATLLSGRFARRVEDPGQTFLASAGRWRVLGLPGFLRGVWPDHRALVDLLGDVLEGRSDARRFLRRCAIHALWRMGQAIRAGRGDPDILVAYWPQPDLAGHLLWGRGGLRRTYEMMDRIAARVKGALRPDRTLVVSDHGMGPAPEGPKVGEHTWRGFWSLDPPLGLHGKAIRVEEFAAVVGGLLLG